MGRSEWGAFAQGYAIGRSIIPVDRNAVRELWVATDTPGVLLAWDAGYSIGVSDRLNGIDALLNVRYAEWAGML